MVNNPYRVLGVSANATDEEIKKSYRNLAKKYHPDSNLGDKSAEQKMKEINAAYDQLTHNRNNIGGTTSGAPSSYGSSDPFGGFNSYQWQRTTYHQESAEIRTARNYINNRQYQNAINILNNIVDRNARWYYYSALAYAGIGDRVKAQQYVQRALQMDPGNPDYFLLLVRLQNQSQAYNRRDKRYTSPIVLIIKFFARLFFWFLILNLLFRFLIGC